MSWRHDHKSTHDDMISDVAHKHTPDSVRESAYRELERRSYSKKEVQQEALKKHDDFWG